ncbi:hypothetical protein T03_10389, partial [Trichinella britovi]
MPKIFIHDVRNNSSGKFIKKPQKAFRFRADLARLYDGDESGVELPPPRSCTRTI